jgi:hypothetical protein
MRLRYFNEALASYDRAVDLKPDFAEAFSNRGVVDRTVALRRSRTEPCADYGLLKAMLDQLGLTRADLEI